ncbi:hypothetical protein PAN31117_05162 [Pandoraea anapnoica]|uniref:Uncharacterized protein n=1 Tax=Pandoraea anapnoica TaxID=2508301 RepID=A0A5E5ARM8_9BURK|nr:hypothetical protein [Pandoraea anapnoica]VVE75442.1 hypothetical protein PAN31117_05162 [Pandoraea anapnoica]
MDDVKAAQIGAGQAFWAHLENLTRVPVGRALGFFVLFCGVAPQVVIFCVIRNTAPERAFAAELSLWAYLMPVMAAFMAGHGIFDKTNSSRTQTVEYSTSCYYAAAFMMLVGLIAQVGSQHATEQPSVPIYYMYVLIGLFVAAILAVMIRYGFRWRDNKWTLNTAEAPWLAILMGAFLLGLFVGWALVRLIRWL